MILVAGLSPAWQQILVFDAVRRGEVNRASETHHCASGKVINVGLAVARLGAPHHLVTAVGGPPAAPIRSDLDSACVAATLIETRRPTRVCTTLVDESDGSITELVENAASIEAPELKSFREAVSNWVPRATIGVFTGSLPTGAATSLPAEVMRETDIPWILDIRGEPLLQALPLRPYVVKPNRSELAETLQIGIDDDDSLVAAMRELNGRGARWVIVSDGARPTWVSSENAAYRVHSYPIAARNPIGSGDCFTAGLAVRLAANDEMSSAIRFAIGAAAANAAVLLPADFTSDDVIEIAAHVDVERIG